MKSTYTTPQAEVISAEALELLSVSIGDVDINVGDGFF